MCNRQTIHYDHHTQSESDDSCCFHMSGENEIDVTIHYDHQTQSESDDSCCFHMSGENEIDV